MANTTLTPTAVPDHEYSAQEREKLAQLRINLADTVTTDEQKEDVNLIRWLRARDLDLKKAEEMFRNDLAWREANEIDGIVDREEIPVDVESTGPIGMCGFDAEGVPILLSLMGKQDFRTILEAYGKEQCHRYNTIMMEKLGKLITDESVKRGKKVMQFNEILDLDGYSYRQLSSKMCREFMVEMQKSMDAHYPELLRYCLIVNAPKVFALLFAMLKPFVPKRTLEKVDIYGPDPEKWKKVIAEKFPLDRIPPHWGGTLKGRDEFGSGTDIWIQGPSDLRSFVLGISEDDKDFEVTTVNARDKLIKELNIDEVDTVLEWKFKTETLDIGFQIVCESLSDGNDTEIVSYSRVNAQDTVQKGSHICKLAGTYKLMFDNKFSFFKAKTLLYQINVISPDGDAMFQECPEF